MPYTTYPYPYMQKPPPPVPPFLRHDDCTDPDPLPLWGTLDAAYPERHEQFSSGGPGDLPYRQLTSVDGDPISGERCELGHNEHRYGLADADHLTGTPVGTFMLYEENTTWQTSYWIWMSGDWALASPLFQCVTQMKQSNPSAGGGGSPAIELDVRNNRFEMLNGLQDDFLLWHSPIELETWYFLVWTVTYSLSADVGRQQLSIAKLTGDTLGTADESPEFEVETMVAETAGGTVYAEGEALPSHLRIGTYHHTSLGGNHVRIADVRVEEP